MNRIEQMLKQMSEWWSKTTLNQKVILLMSSVVGLVIAGGIIYFAIQPDYTILFSKLSPQDANAVVEHLQESNVPYRLSAGGGMVEIPSKSVYDMRIQLAGKGLPKGDGIGFEIFDKVSFGVTDEVQQINYLRALQNELECTIDSIDVIQKSRVHLVLPKDDVWFQERSMPTASVMIKLATGGALLPYQIDSIRHVLASAVSGLSAERVTIVDTNCKVVSTAGDGNGAGNLSEKQINYKNKIEKDLKAKAEELLFEIVGQQKAVVQVFADVDFDQIVRENEYFTPVVGNRGLVRSEKRNSVTPIKNNANAGGIAGTASNLQGYPPGGLQSRNSSKKNEKQTSYEMNRTVERVTTATGRIKKLSVGIFIDGEMKEDKLSAIQGVVEKAMGIDATRGDKLEIKSIPFQPKYNQEDKTLLEKSEKERFIMTIATKWAPRALLVIIAVSFLFVSMKNMKKIVAAAAQSVPVYRENEGNAQRGFEPEKILSEIKQNPDETAKVLKNWMS